MTTDDRLEALSNELREIQDRIGELKRAEKATLSRIGDLIGEQRGTVEAHGKPVLSVSYGKRFNVDQARVILASNPELLAACSETVIVPAKAKQVLPPAVYELCQVENDSPSIKPKVAG